MSNSESIQKMERHNDVEYQSIKRCVETIIRQREYDIEKTQQMEKLENISIYQMLKFVIQTKLDMCVSYRLPQSRIDYYQQLLDYVDFDFREEYRDSKIKGDTLKLRLQEGSFLESLKRQEKYLISENGQ